MGWEKWNCIVFVALLPCLTLSGLKIICILFDTPATYVVQRYIQQNTTNRIQFTRSHVVTVHQHVQDTRVEHQARELQNTRKMYVKAIHCHRYTSMLGKLEIHFKLTTQQFYNRKTITTTDCTQMHSTPSPITTQSTAPQTSHKNPSQQSEIACNTIHEHITRNNISFHFSFQHLFYYNVI